MKKYLSLDYLSPAILVIFLAKSFFLPPNIFDFGVISLMAYGLNQKLKKAKVELDDKEEILAKFEEVEKELNNKMRQMEEVVKTHKQELDTKVSTLNLGMNMKPKDKAQSYGWR